MLTIDAVTVNLMWQRLVYRGSWFVEHSAKEAALMPLLLVELSNNLLTKMSPAHKTKDTSVKLTIRFIIDAFHDIV